MSFKTLNIGVTALMSQKLGLDITGQNIANASTPGYARQRVSLEAVTPTVQTYGAAGNGVGIKSIKHITDEFLEKQVRIAYSANENLGALEDAYTNVEVYFNELTENDLSTSMDKFWQALSDFNNNVEDVSNRRVVLEQAKNLADSFHNIESKLQNYRERQNEAIVDTVGDVNAMITEIAQLNQDIVKMESGGTSGVTANDLRDQRTQRLKELSGLMDVNVNEEPNGAVIVSQKTRLLVFQNQHFDLTTKQVLSDGTRVDEVVFAEDGEEVTIGNGLLAAQIQIRDEIVLGYKEQLDQLAASFAWEVNRIHTQGVGLSGYSDVKGLYSVNDPSVKLNQLQYDFTPKDGTFEIQNGNFEIVLHDVNSGTDRTVNVEIDLDGNSAHPDTILYDPTEPEAENALVNKIQKALDSVLDGGFTVSLDLGNRLQIESNQNDVTLGFGRDTSGVLAGLGVNCLFTGYSASTFNVSETLDGNPQLLAGARSFVAGDQTGAQALLVLRETGVMNDDVATLDDFYEGIIGQLGIEASRIASMRETQADILTRVENQRESLSGVNLDEELTKMILYQRSYQSAARFISTADTLYETLINM